MIRNVSAADLGSAEVEGTGDGNLGPTDTLAAVKPARTSSHELTRLACSGKRRNERFVSCDRRSECFSCQVRWKCHLTGSVPSLVEGVMFQSRGTALLEHHDMR